MNILLRAKATIWSIVGPQEIVVVVVFNLLGCTGS